MIKNQYIKKSLKKGFLIVKLRFVFLPTAFIVYWILVHCRVGRFKVESYHGTINGLVHCRVGRFKVVMLLGFPLNQVHCRVGRFKDIAKAPIRLASVHCRVGRFKASRRDTMIP